MSFLFTETLVPTVKKPIATDVLLERLERLHGQLRQQNPETPEEIAAFLGVAAGLANAKLLRHKTQGVVVYTCCCIADVLRIFAPDAPYTAAQLSTIFKVMISEMARLGRGADQTYSAQYEYLLKSLVEYRLILLLTDCTEAGQLIEELFMTFYKVVATAHFPARLEHAASGLLLEVIGEAEVIPHEVLELVLSRLNREPDQLSKRGIVDAGFQFSVGICEANVDRMSRLVAQYFSELLYADAEALESEKQLDKRSKSGKSDLANTSLKKLHELSVHLWQYVPEIVAPVLLLIDDELNADDVSIRVLATSTLGRIIGSANVVGGTETTTKINFFAAYPQVWRSYLSKITDVAHQVRVAWVEHVGRILSAPTAHGSEILAGLAKAVAKAMRDLAESVRRVAFQSQSLVEWANLLMVVGDSWIEGVVQGCRDKNAGCREAAIDLAGTVYNAYKEGSSNLSSYARLSEIPLHILELSYINDRSVDAAVDKVWWGHIIPMEMPTSDRVRRMVGVYEGLTPRAKDALVATYGRQQLVSAAVSQFVDMGQTSARTKGLGKTLNEMPPPLTGNESTEVNDKERVNRVIEWLNVQFPTEWQADVSLERLYRKGTARHWFLLRRCIAVDSSFTTVRNGLTELLGSFTDDALRRVVHLLVLRSAYLMFNSSNVGELIRFALGLPVARTVLQHMLTYVPTLVAAHLDDLYQLATANGGDQTVLALTTVANYAEATPDYQLPADFVDKLVSIAVSSQSPLEVSYAVSLVGSTENRLLTKDIFQHVYPLDSGHKDFTCHLAALAELVLVDPELVQPHTSEYTTVLIREVLLKNVGEDDEEPENIEDKPDALAEGLPLAYPRLANKVLAICIFVNRLVGLAKLKKYAVSELVAAAQPVFKLLVLLIGNAGEIIPETSPDFPTPQDYRQRLRLDAGLAVLELATYPEFDDAFLPTTLRRLVVLLVDANAEVRRRFLDDLNRKLVDRSIGKQFIAVVFYTAFEPDRQQADNARMWISLLYRRERSHKWEKLLARLIFLLAHDDQFEEMLKEEGDDGLLHACQYVAKVLRYFISIICNQANVLMLYYLAARVKQYRDIYVEPELYNEHPLPLPAQQLYIVADVAQALLKAHSDAHSWPVNTWDKKIKLDADMFTQMATASEVRETLTTVFVPEPIQVEIVTRRKPLARAKQNKRVSTSKETPKKKRAKAAAVEPLRKSSRARKAVNYNDEASDSIEDSDSDKENEALSDSE